MGRPRDRVSSTHRSRSRVRHCVHADRSEAFSVAEIENDVGRDPFHAIDISVFDAWVFRKVSVILHGQTVERASTDLPVT
jgi:hypothetical protein